jgi:hypothetical protein
MMEAAVYGLPVRMPHWSFEVRYIYQLIQHRMGHSRLFEVVFPGNPGRAYLAKGNSLQENTLVVAHVLGHADFSKHNELFRRSQAEGGYRIVEQAADHARQIAAAMEEFGEERVEKVLDAALTLEAHIDAFKGLSRERYPEYAEDRVIDGALKQAGVVRLHKYSHLFLTAKALASMPLPHGNRVSFLAPSGAMLVVLTDLCLSLGLQVPQFAEETRQKLQGISPPIIRIRNPVDIWFAAGIHGVDFAYREGIEAALKDPNIDAVVPILLLTDDTGVPPLDFIVELARKYPEKPVYVTFTGEKKHMDAGKAFLEPRGVPTFPLIEDPFEILGLLARCRKLWNGNKVRPYTVRRSCTAGFTEARSGGQLRK